MRDPIEYGEDQLITQDFPQYNFGQSRGGALARNPRPKDYRFSLDLPFEEVKNHEDVDDENPLLNRTY